MQIGEKELSRLPPHLQALFVKLPNPGKAEVLAAFPETTSGVLKAGTIRNSENKIYGKGMAAAGVAATNYDTGGDSGSAARFFFSSKADSQDRLGSKHPTVKPVDLLQWLCRLVTPPGGTILDPFAGTGTTGEAAWREGFNAVLIEREAEYLADIARRMKLASEGQMTRKHESAKAKANGKAQDHGPLFGGIEVAGGANTAAIGASSTSVQSNNRTNRAQMVRIVE